MRGVACCTTTVKEISVYSRTAERGRVDLRQVSEATGIPIGDTRQVPREFAIAGFLIEHEQPDGEQVCRLYEPADGRQEGRRLVARALAGTRTVTQGLVVESAPFGAAMGLISFSLGGLRYVFSADDQGTITAAKNSILYSLIAMLGSSAFVVITAARVQDGRKSGRARPPRRPAAGVLAPAPTACLLITAQAARRRSGQA
ncbi:hypothetical protein [Streptomyces sp. NPDC057939]|uniref:hypothetical protein n=1 Tax=Streptomyces sp. NPDC057939 TaxID=3346284 RepID=UPI0036EED0CA